MNTVKTTLAILGVIIFLAGAFLGYAISDYRRAPAPGEVEAVAKESALWSFVETKLGLTPDQASILSIAGFFTGTGVNDALVVAAFASLARLVGEAGRTAKFAAAGRYVMCLSSFRFQVSSFRFQVSWNLKPET